MEFEINKLNDIREKYLVLFQLTALKSLSLVKKTRVIITRDKTIVASISKRILKS